MNFHISGSIGSSLEKKKNQRVNVLYPFRNSLSTALFFDRFLAKLAGINGQILLEPVLISTRAVPPLLTCKLALNLV